ncbi:hypothetical protein LTR85_003361 [Meristemomyces frigidus]|nr:hypothetical protein LTR85_003361 [Meristemomyces frigidus]
MFYGEAIYAVNAPGALHEERHLRKVASDSGLDVSAVKTSFPVLQYSRALNGLQSLLGANNPPIDVVLMCVLLLVHFEALRESFVPALVHMEHAIRLLHSRPEPEARKIDSSLVRSMMRLDIQGSMYLGGRIPGMPFYTAPIDSVLPSTFHDLTQARNTINTWTCRLFYFARVDGDIHRRLRGPGDTPLEAIARSHDLVQTFVDLDRLLWDFMHKSTVRLTVREQHGLGVLRSRVKINRMLSATYLYTEATMFDAFLQEFQDVVAICMHIMGSEKADHRLFSVSLDEGLLQPLFYTVIHCRDSRTRRQALAYLEKLPAQGGIWHIEATTRTARVCVEFEESHCSKESPLCEDIPEWCRVHSAGFDGWDVQVPQQKVNSHLRYRPNGMDGEWAELSTSIEWSIPGDSGLGPDEVRLLMTDNALMRETPLMLRPASLRGNNVT